LALRSTRRAVPLSSLQRHILRVLAKHRGPNRSVPARLPGGCVRRWRAGVTVYGSARPKLVTRCWNVTAPRRDNSLCRPRRRNIATGLMPLPSLRLHVGSKDGVHAGQVASALFPEPVQDIGIHAEMN
jgi:hypothetical protein